MLAIKEAVKCISLLPPLDFKAHSQKVAQAEAQIEHLKGLMADLFRVEAEASKTLYAALGKAEHHLATVADKGYKLQKIKESNERLVNLSNAYQRLSLEPLTWRDAEGFPRLVVFSLRSSIFKLRVLPNGYFFIEPDLPTNIANQYNDVLQLLVTMKPKGKGFELICQFEGLIPREVRQKIQEARELFGDNIFIIAEPKKWKLNEIIPLPTGDPLIVGYAPGDDPNGLWLIAEFDTTSVEKAMIMHSK